MATIKKANPRAKLSPTERAWLRLETGCSDATIGRWANGAQDIREATNTRLTRACQKRGIEVLA